MRISLFDVGGTFIKHGILDDSGLSSAEEMPTPSKKGAAALLETLACRLKADLACGPLDGVGISTRGQVDFFHGVIIYDPPEVIPGYTGTDIPAALRTLVPALKEIPIVVENDGNCAALAEAVWGAGREYEDSLCVVFGTAIGGGIIFHKDIYRGSAFSAGEFGMMYLPAEKEGLTTYESYASTSELVSMTMDIDASLTDGRKICAALEDGNPAVFAAVDLWSSRVALGLASLIHLFNPPCLLLGGGIMENSLVVSRVREHTLGLLAPGFTHVAILPASLGNKAGMLGAGCLALGKDNLFQLPL